MTSLLQCIRHKNCMPGRECPTALACDHKIRKPALQVRRLPVTAAAVASSSIAVDGGNLEILSSGSEKVSDAPPILFLHGAAHGAWCWAERLMPDLEQAGLKTYAMSFRGHVRDLVLYFCVDSSVAMGMRDLHDLPSERHAHKSRSAPVQPIEVFEKRYRVKALGRPATKGEQLGLYCRMQKTLHPSSGNCLPLPCWQVIRLVGSSFRGTL